MNGQRVGYVRVSTFEPNAERPLEDVEIDRTFTDKASGEDGEFYRSMQRKRRECCVEKETPNLLH